MIRGRVFCLGGGILCFVEEFFALGGRRAGTPSQTGSPVCVWYADGPRVSIGATLCPVGHRGAFSLLLILFVGSRELSVALSCARCTECREVHG